MKDTDIKDWAAAHKAAIIAAAVALVLCIAGVGTAFALSANPADEPYADEGITGSSEDADEAAEPEVADEVPEGAEIVEDENAPEGTVAVKDASGNVSYVSAEKAEAAVNAGTAKPSAGSSNSGSATAPSAPAQSAPAPSAPVHTHSFTIAKTVVDQEAWTEYGGIIHTLCTNCGNECSGNISTCCGAPTAVSRDTVVIAEHPAVTHTEYYCSCGAHA